MIIPTGSLTRVIAAFDDMLYSLLGTVLNLHLSNVTLTMTYPVDVIASKIQLRELQRIS